MVSKKDQSTYGFNRSDAEGLVGLLGGREYEVPTSFVVSSGSTISFAFPPTSGIPATSYNDTDDELTTSQASCELAELVDGVYVRSGDSVMVENPVGVAVGTSGRPMVIGKSSYGRWTVLVEDCTEATVTSESVVNQDPISGGGKGDVGIGLF
jgi:hypothetical protein